MEQISAAVLPHEHSGHVGGLEVCLSKREHLPVYTIAQTSSLVRETLNRKPKWQVFHAGDSFTLCDFSVECFLVTHDVVDPVGFGIHLSRRRDGSGLAERHRPHHAACPSRFAGLAWTRFAWFSCWPTGEVGALQDVQTDGS